MDDELWEAAGEAFEFASRPCQCCWGVCTCAYSCTCPCVGIACRDSGSRLPRKHACRIGDIGESLEGCFRTRFARHATFCLCLRKSLVRLPIACFDARSGHSRERLLDLSGDWMLGQPGACWPLRQEDLEEPNPGKPLAAAASSAASVEPPGPAGPSGAAAPASEKDPPPPPPRDHQPASTDGRRAERAAGRARGLAIQPPAPRNGPAGGIPKHLRSKTICAGHTAGQWEGYRCNHGRFCP